MNREPRVTPMTQVSLFNADCDRFVMASVQSGSKSTRSEINLVHYTYRQVKIPYAEASPRNRRFISRRTDQESAFTA